MGKIKGRVVGTLLAGALFALALAGASLADHNANYHGTADTHFVVDGDPGCPAGTTTGGSFTLEPGSNGTYGQGGLVIITGHDGQKFNWNFTQLGLDTKDMGAVIVKGGPNAVVYTYDAGSGGSDDADVGLTAPLDGDNPYQITKIQFCMDVKGGPETGKLIVKKVIVGSDASFSSFSFSVDGSTQSFDSGGQNEVELPEGTYTVTEPEANQNGFTTTYDNCKGVKVDGDGDAPVCTITNTFEEQPPPETFKLVVRKLLVNSDAPYDSFSFTVDGTTTPFDPSDGRNTVELPAGTYTVTEPEANQNGYTTTYFNCTSIELGPGIEPKSCRITNTLQEQPPGNGSLIVRKVVVGSDDSPSTFSFTVNGLTTPFEADGENVVQLPEGTYDVTEPQANQNGFTTTSVGCDEVQVSGNQEAIPVCTFTNTKESTPPPTPPTPPFVPSSPKLDVWVQKGATPQATLVNGSAAITYDLVVSNNGPNQANDVTLDDTAPAGVTFGAITAGPSKGTCAITSTTLSCNFGTVGPGVVVTLSVSATVTATGTYSNTACVASAGNADTNLANNCSTANTVVVAPITPPVTPPVTPKPPKPKPKPKPKPNVCAILTISTRTLSAGKSTGIAVKVTRAGKGVAKAKVRFRGPGILKTVTTRNTGIAVTKLRPAKSGIVRISIVNKKACSAKRIGVLGTFQPPVTG